MNFEKGQNVSCIIYHGVSKIEADALYNTINKYKKEKSAFRLKGTEFSILISETNKRTTPGTERYDTIYEISMKGELV